MTSSAELDKSLKFVAKASMILFFGVVLSKILTYAYKIVIARYFGPEIYGLFSLALLVSSFFICFFAFGLHMGLSRFVPMYKAHREFNKIRYLFRTALFISLFSSILAGFILFSLAEFFSLRIFHTPNLVIFLRFFSVTIPLTILLNLFLAALASFEKVGWHSLIFNISQNLIKIVFLVFFIYLGASNTVSLTYILGILGALLLAYIVSKRILSVIFEKYSLERGEKRLLFKEMVSYSIPLMLFGIISILFSWTDTFFIGYFKTAKEVGYYNAATTIITFLTVIPELFIQFFFPVITKEYQKNNLFLIEELSKQVTKWIFILSLPIFVLFLLFPGAIINLLFRQDYLGVAPALQFLSIGAFIVVLFGVSHQLILMIGKSRLVLFNVIAAASLDVVLNFLFVPMEKIWFIDNSIGVTGAALATMISLIFLYGLSSFQAYWYLSIIPLRRKMLRIVFVSAIPTLLLFYLRTRIPLTSLTVILLGFGFLASYFLLILLSGSLDRNDWMILKNLWEKIGKKLPFYQKSIVDTQP